MQPLVRMGLSLFNASVALSPESSCVEPVLNSLLQALTGAVGVRAFAWLRVCSQRVRPRMTKHSVRAKTRRKSVVTTDSKSRCHWYVQPSGGGLAPAAPQANKRAQR